MCLPRGPILSPRHSREMKGSDVSAQVSSSSARATVTGTCCAFWYFVRNVSTRDEESYSAGVSRAAVPLRMAQSEHSSSQQRMYGGAAIRMASLSS